MNEGQALEHHEVAALLPYGWPWLLIDRVSSWTPSRRIVTQKALSASDPLLNAHFAGGPRTMPGVLMIELAAQSAMLLGKLSGGSSGTSFLARCQATFSSPALVGEVLTATVELRDTVRGTRVYDALIRCGDREVCKTHFYGAQASLAKEEV